MPVQVPIYRRVVRTDAKRRVANYADFVPSACTHLFAHMHDELQYTYKLRQSPGQDLTTNNANTDRMRIHQFLLPLFLEGATRQSSGE